MKALILVDIQRDFCKNGALEVKDGDAVVPIANKLIESFQKNKDMTSGVGIFLPPSMVASSSTDTQSSFAVFSSTTLIRASIYESSSVYEGSIFKCLFAISKVTYAILLHRCDTE